MIEKVRRVVLGAQPGEPSTFTRVEEIASFETEDGSMTSWPVWGWDEVPPVPHADVEHDPAAPYPGPGGLRVVALRGHGDTAGAVADMGRALPGFTHDDARPGMHSTDTIDVAMVIEGKATVEAGDGTKVTLGLGDVYVCNGALHRWHYDESTHIVFIVVGAERAR
ncbi:hypothetical protein DSM104299_00171 [Baekduia alba]|uniref:hypothetical protein n=1 Tax=Baekduia alba TaxID=2997333 RepID=UPI00233FBF36|nr:hypothetical protein [Baekduia alba]WCB91500.1 hypothetical protein DSM104299_00171 [Baekduia alba]